ncbi:MAG TPA: glucosamine-6-phosphate deaminase [Vicinamibacteria bacterium]|nr:glucosamine-6-phosphate deaminase [Vicinamibacteria bacterium]
MELRVLDDARAVAVAGADLLAGAASPRGGLVLALPTGRTPIPMYDELAARHARGELRLGPVTAFQLDELVLPFDDPRTFRVFLRDCVWSRLGVPDDRCHLPDTAARSLEAECRRYEERLAEAGGLDLAVLGLGVDGHVAYNLPRPPSLDTHVRALPDGVAEENRVPEAERPLRAITMGLATLRRARRLVILATGPSKAEPLRMLRTRTDDPDWPCTFLASHRDLTVLVDRPAAARL